MMKMKKRVAVVLLFALCLAQIPVAPKAKAKKVKLNLTKVSLLQGATVQLKLLNKKAGAVKWYSKNKKKATVTKKGCTDPQMLDQKSNDWRSIFLWLNIVLNLKRK